MVHVYKHMLDDSANDTSPLSLVDSQAIKDVIGPREDIPAPDMNTDGRVMSWFFDEYTKFEGFSPAVVTGKVCLHLCLTTVLCASSFPTYGAS